MPIMAAHRQNDARGTARLLAIAARDCLRDPATASEKAVALNNVYRLLEAYRTNAFFGLEAPRRQFPHRATEAISLLPRAERHVKDVRTALEQATAAVFAGQSKEAAISIIENVLRGIAYPHQFAGPSDDDRTKAFKFFEEVLQRLNVG